MRSALLSLSIASLSLAFIHCGSTATSNVDAGEPTHDSGKADSGKTKADTGADASHPECTPAVPTSHRPSVAACSTTRPPSQPGDAGTPAPDAGGQFGCEYDSQCTGGTNGRCGPTQAGDQCSYDECSTDAECGSGKLCQCGAANGDERYANVCVPGNCTSDSDCGSGGYCSPTYDTTCGAYDGVVGYFCHVAADECTKDECVNDSDCVNEDDGGIQQGEGYCAWDPSGSKWSCYYGVCAG